MLKGLLKEAGSLGPGGGVGNEAQLHPSGLCGAKGLPHVLESRLVSPCGTSSHFV